MIASADAGKIGPFPHGIPQGTGERNSNDNSKRKNQGRAQRCGNNPEQRKEDRSKQSVRGDVRKTGQSNARGKNEGMLQRWVISEAALGHGLRMYANRIARRKV